MEMVLTQILVIVRGCHVSNIKIVPLDFMGQGALLQPRDQHLHDLVVEYCQQNIVGGADLNLSTLAKVFVAVELDEDDIVTKVHGVTGIISRPDIPVFRATCAAATTKLHQRCHSYLADNGYLGQEVFIHLSNKELPEQRCAGYETEVEAAKLVPADRYLVKVRGS